MRRKIKIAIRVLAVMCGAFVTILAATGKTHPNRFEYAFLWAYATVVVIGRLIKDIRGEAE